MQAHREPGALWYLNTSPPAPIPRPGLFPAPYATHPYPCTRSPAPCTRGCQGHWGTGAVVRGEQHTGRGGG